MFDHISQKQDNKISSLNFQNFSQANNYKFVMNSNVYSTMEKTNKDRL